MTIQTSRQTLAALLLTASLFGTGAQAGAVIADWSFSDAGQTALNNTANSGAGVNGAGSSWNVGITGLSTNGAGLLNIANDGQGGSGTRSAYADFGPNFDSIHSGTLSLYTHFSAWHPAASPSGFSLGFIEGNDFSTAEFTFAASAAGLTLAGGVDAYGNGSSLPASANFAVFQALTVRLDVNLDLLSYSLAYDSGAGFNSLGGAQIDSATLGINSLRLGLFGDFSHNALTVDRIWVEETPALAIPEPAGLILALTGLGMMRLVLAGRNKRQAKI